VQSFIRIHLGGSFKVIKEDAIAKAKKVTGVSSVTRSVVKLRLATGDQVTLLDNETLADYREFLLPTKVSHSVGV
jgi:hypothetical protein